VKTSNQKSPCPFSFTIKWDNFGFYVNLDRKCGCSIHENHPKPFDPSSIPIPTRLLTQDEVDDTRYVVESACSKAAGRNFMRTKFGKFINSIKMNYLSKKYTKTPDAKDDISDMLGNFAESNEIAFTTLSDVPLSYLEKCNHPNDSSTSVTMLTTKDPSGKVTNITPNELPGLLPIQDIARKERLDRGTDSVLFILIAWIILPAFRFFLLCPEVIWCDITSHTNNKGFQLLTFSCRTSINKQCVFLWIWIPNQQRYSFRWVFQHAIPTLLPSHVRKRVNLIMKDGDPQQRNEILKALKEIFPNAIEASCGWHIGINSYFVCSLIHSYCNILLNNFISMFSSIPVNQGWKVHVHSGAIAKYKQAQWTVIVRLIHKWMYSWMRPGYVETVAEYAISKCLLFKFVCSARVLDTAGGRAHIVVDILKFIRNHVTVHEDLYLHYIRKRVRHFDAAHASPHEVRHMFGLENM